MLRFSSVVERKIFSWTWNLIPEVSGHLVMVIWSKSKTDCQIPPLYINILFMYSEQITAFPKSKMTKWPWPNDHVKQCLKTVNRGVAICDTALIQGAARIRPLPCFRVLVTLKKYHKNGQNEQKCINYTSIFRPLFFDLLKMLRWWLSVSYKKLTPITVHFSLYYARYERKIWLILQSEKPKW